MQVELSGGGAHGAYECGALEILMPFWIERGFDIKLITGVSAGAVNAALLSYAINSGQQDKLDKIMGGFWEHLGRKGDTYLKPILDMQSLSNTFNYFARAEDKFPNIPSLVMTTMKIGKSDIPLRELKDLLKDHIPAAGWEQIKTGRTETFVGTLRVDEKTGIRYPVHFSGADISPDTIAASAALRDFAPYHVNGTLYEDGGYDKIGFFKDDSEHATDVLFAIGLKPLRNVAELENRDGVKTGQLHHDLARFYQNPNRTTHIDFICLDHPAYWNESSAMNNTSKNINMLREMGRQDALKWIAEHGATFGMKSSFQPSEALVKALTPTPALIAA